MTNTAKNPINWATWVGLDSCFGGGGGGCGNVASDKLNTDPVKPDPAAIEESPKNTEARGC